MTKVFSLYTGISSVLFIMFICVASSHASVDEPIFKTSVVKPMNAVYDAVYAALEEERFYVVFEPNIGANLSRMAKRWGEDYNRNELSGIRSMVFCNAWYANQVSNLDPDMLALCPLHVTLYARDNETRIVFTRPGHVGEGSQAQALLLELEDAVAAAIETAIAPPLP